MEPRKRQRAIVIEQMSDSFMDELERLIPHDRLKASIRTERSKFNRGQFGPEQTNESARPSEVLLEKFGADSAAEGAANMTSDAQFVLKNRPQDIFQQLLWDQGDAEIGQ